MAVFLTFYDPPQGHCECELTPQTSTIYDLLAPHELSCDGVSMQTDSVNGDNPTLLAAAIR